MVPRSEHKNKLIYSFLFSTSCTVQGHQGEKKIFKLESFSQSVVVIKVFSRAQTHSEHGVQSEAVHITRRIKHGRYYRAVPERKCMILTVLALQLSLSCGSGNGGPLVQVSGLRPNERHLSVISVPVLED